MLNKLLPIVNMVLESRGRARITEITENTHLRNQIGFDSLDLAQLTVLIEAEYGIDVFEAGIVNTIGEIEAKLATR